MDPKVFIIRICYVIPSIIVGVARLFDSLQSHDSKLTAIENELNRNMDEMYFLHASLFSMRSRQLEVSAAKDILATGRYRALPSSIFTCGAPVLPSSFSLSKARLFFQIRSL
jgi:hypothetical protein